MNNFEPRPCDPADNRMRILLQGKESKQGTTITPIMCNSTEAPERDCSDVIYLVYGARREGVGQKILVLCRIIADYHYQRPSGPVSVILGVFFNVNTPVWADIPRLDTTMAPTVGELKKFKGFSVSGWTQF